MTELESKSSTGMYELAMGTWQEVYGVDGEVDSAKKIIGLGTERLHYLSKYQSWDETALTGLESAVRGLKAAIGARERTAQEFIDTAVTELS